MRSNNTSKWEQEQEMRVIASNISSAEAEIEELTDENIHLELEVKKLKSEIARLRLDNGKLDDVCKMQRDEIDKWVGEAERLRGIIGGLECLMARSSPVYQSITCKCQTCRAKQAIEKEVGK